MIALIDLNRDTTWAPASSRPGTGGVHSQAQQQDLAYSRWTDAQRIAYHPRQAGRYCGSVTVGNCRPPRLAGFLRVAPGPMRRELRIARARAPPVPSSGRAWGRAAKNWPPVASD